jgi:DNA-binding response OmpR family regulator
MLSSDLKEVFMRILVIDDSPVQYKLAKYYLETGFGHKVLQASCGMDGIEQAITIRPDVIILDVEMPELSGKDTLRVLKKIKRTAMIPVIMAGTDLDFAVKDILLAMGASAFIKKSQDMGSLNDKILSLCAMTHQTA